MSQSAKASPKNQSAQGSPKSQNAKAMYSGPGSPQSSTVGRKAGTKNQNPIIIQPGVIPYPDQSTIHPGSIPGVPEGLEYLVYVDELIVKQEVELLEVFTAWDCKNRYSVYNNQEQRIYYAFEESNVCQRQCCSKRRGLVIHVTDNQQQEVMTISRKFKCCNCCSWCADNCCSHPMIIKDKFGTKIGMVRMMNSCCKYHFGIFNENNALLYEIWAPCLNSQCLCKRGDINFPVCNARDNVQVANIRKIWGGILKEMYTTADNIGVSCMYVRPSVNAFIYTSIMVCLFTGDNGLFVGIPIDLLIVHKALMLSLIFLIDLIMYETERQD